MLNALWLILIVPLSMAAGFMVAALCAAVKDRKDK